MQPLPQLGRQLVEFVRPIHFDRLARRVQRDHAVLAALQMFFEIGAQSGRYTFIDQVIELCYEFRARHLAPSPLFLRK